jgi:hypothetical protein
MAQHHPGMRHYGMTVQLTTTQPGQGAFGAVQEIVRILRADPATTETLDKRMRSRANPTCTLLRRDRAGCVHFPGSLQIAPDEDFQFLDHGRVAGRHGEPPKLLCLAAQRDRPVC